MSTRFRKMRTRKLHKTKALKTRKHRGGTHPLFNETILKKMASNKEKTDLQILENEKQSLEMKKKESERMLDVYKNTLQSYKDQKVESTKKRNGMVKNKLEPSLIKMQEWEIGNITKMIKQFENTVEKNTKEIKKLEQDIQAVENKIQRVKTVAEEYKTKGGALPNPFAKKATEVVKVNNSFMKVNPMTARKQIEQMGIQTHGRTNKEFQKNPNALYKQAVEIANITKKVEEKYENEKYKELFKYF